MIREVRLLIKEGAASVDDVNLLLTVVRQHMGEKIVSGVTAPGDFLQIEAHQRTAAARHRQAVITAHNTILAFCENIIIYRAVGDVGFTALTDIFADFQQQIV